MPIPIELRVVVLFGAAPPAVVGVGFASVGAARLFLALERDRLVAWRRTRPPCAAGPLIAGLFILWPSFEVPSASSLAALAAAAFS